MSITEKLTRYQELEAEIYSYFGYVEDWVMYPIDISFGKYWYLTGEGRGDTVFFSNSPFLPELIEKGEELYSNIVFRDTFLPKSVYRGDEYTMILVDTRTDGVKCLQIFYNELELKSPSREQLEAFKVWV